MASIAFYAPMKAPTHPTPSGDREMARGLFQLLNENTHGVKTTLASELRIYDDKGGENLQAKIIQQAKAEAQKLIIKGRLENWAAWVSYHNYYKAPDLIGPIVAKALNIPYILLESTRAHKRLTGPWAEFAKLAETASDQADVIFYFTKQDKEALEQYKANQQRIIHLHPFLMQDAIDASPRAKPQKNTLLSVGMMRSGAKTQSYKVISEVLTHLKTTDWQLNIVGDGPNYKEIHDTFQNFGKNISFLGKLDKRALKTAYNTATAFLWPGVDEAYGMVYLEAQAAGLPVIAENRPGVCDVIASETNLIPYNHPEAMAKAIDDLFANTSHWYEQSQASLKHITKNHLKPKASETLWSTLTPLIKR